MDTITDRWRQQPEVIYLLRGLGLGNANKHMLVAIPAGKKTKHSFVTPPAEFHAIMEYLLAYYTIYSVMIQVQSFIN